MREITSHPPLTAPPPRKRRRWWLYALAFIALLILLPVGLWLYATWATQNALAEAVAEAEQDIPRWRLLELEEDRAKVPDEENSALHIMAVNRLRGGVDVELAPRYREIFEELPPTAQLNTQQIRLIKIQLAKIPKAVIEARKLKDMPRGRFPMKYSDDWLSTSVDRQQESRGVAGLLQHDAYLLAQDRKIDEAIQSCQALLNTGRSMRDELFLIQMLIRINLDTRCVETTERVLAQGTASDPALTAMQRALERESKVEQFPLAIRGERAGHHHFCENVRVGKVRMGNLTGAVKGGRNPQDWFLDQFPIVMLQYYPEHLKLMNRIVEISKLPCHERDAKLVELELEVKGSKNTLSRMLVPAMLKVQAADTRTQANLRCAAVALACERYRVNHKQWPASLDVLVKEKLLDAVPRDPIDNQPLRYRRTRDGVVIYSVSFDKTDNQGHIDRLKSPLEPGMDIGFRLWDMSKRRQPSLPPIAEREVN